MTAARQLLVAVVCVETVRVCCSSVICYAEGERISEEAKSVVLDAVPTPSFAIILSRHRGGTSHLSSVLGQHPCVLNGNEILNRSPHQDALRAHSIAPMSTAEIVADPMRFLRAARGPLCQQHAGKQCGKQCMIVLKLFDIHLRTKAIPMLLANDTSVLVLERHPEHAYCSLLHASQTGDWETTPAAYALNGFAEGNFRQ